MAVDLDFVAEYSILLAKQYWEKEKAKAEIELKASTYSKVFSFFESISPAYDLDLAEGVQLDVLGKIIGLTRSPSQSDDGYRFLLKAKAAKNYCAAFMVTDGDRYSIQEVIQAIFAGLAYAVDNYDMTLSLFVDPSIDVAQVQSAIDADLFPKPQGVRWEGFQIAGPDTFGFSINPNAKTFADKFDPAFDGGMMSEKVI